MHFPKNKDFSEFIKEFERQYNQKLPFVLFRKPNSEIVKGIFQSSDTLYRVEDFQESGFVFAPFHWDETKVLIHVDDTKEVSFEHESNPRPNDLKPIDSGKKTHLKLLDKAIRLLKSGKLQKVVLSRSIIANTAKTPFELFVDALNTYQNAFCYLWYHPEVGLWLGASPETLLNIKKRSVETVSLAGTKKANSNVSSDWGPKELEEQQLVTDYITSCFQEHLKKVKIFRAETFQAGDLIHLRSKIKGLKSDDFSLMDLLKDLHPTPAVGGLPKIDALEFINRNENYKREFYTGFMGELNMGNTNDTHLFVNLRCLQIKDGKAIIYVGGGITSKSNSIEEWLETQNKSLTMLKLL